MPQKLKFWIWKKADWNYSRLLKQFFNGTEGSVRARPQVQSLAQVRRVHEVATVLIMVTRFESN
ncbi:hypothetical protein JG687_00005424 [Phytophthora cactorum]|uniref:Uncharacterized protein n=1 Tax=Phytophthora cactorum TaxID=29920 RepID=A0A8T1UL49_9STRA|nr:hypothetical protein JG687_00005424 [Phytophthora cactorum]